MFNLHGGFISWEKEGSRNSTPCAHVLFQYMLGFQGVFIFPNFQCESQNSWLCWFTGVVGYFQGPLATNFPISVADVSNDLKNISQIGSFLQVGVKIQNIWNHHLDEVATCSNLVPGVLPVGKRPCTQHTGTGRNFKESHRKMHLVKQSSYVMIWTWNPKQPFLNGCLVKQPFCK